MVASDAEGYQWAPLEPGPAAAGTPQRRPAAPLAVSWRRLTGASPGGEHEGGKLDRTCSTDPGADLRKVPQLGPVRP